ncbi:maltose alpha-D-glucosyltransferase [Bacteroidota bacterium]
MMDKKFERVTWYKDAIIYELHIKAFMDGNSDGMGDFDGLLQRLDYLEDLGITTIWLLPFFPSPFRDDGYDIADYYNVNELFGDLKTFRKFLKEAHKRGLKVIIELVLNHTSDEHEWFKRAKKAKSGSVYRDFYSWSDDPDKYADTRIIFTDYEVSNWTWDHEAGQYFWHRFFSHQPDLNFNNPSVQKEVFRILEFWCKMGVDGFRLDAVPYLFEEEGTNNENLPQTHDFLKRLRKFIDEKYDNIMLLAEANMWPEDSASYFGDGDECQMNFHFPLMPRMFMAVNMEDRYPIVEIIDQTPTIPDNCQWGTFLRNHDELTLEMVTDEERDYMYKVYTKDPLARINLGIRKRLAPLLDNDRRKIELLNVLLFSLPGTPVIYYGDEIGMGDNYYLGDRDGVRTPMQWDPGRNGGFSDANPQQLYLPLIIDPEYKFENINVENQQKNTNSLLWWMKHLIRMRKRYKAFGRGEIKFLEPENRKIIAFTRTFNSEELLIIVNLSRFAQPVELDMEDYDGYLPVEVFSRSNFPRITKQPYIFTLAPYGYYWFELTKEKADIFKDEPIDFSFIFTVEKWDALFSGKKIKELESYVLPKYIMKRRWFFGKDKGLESVKIQDNIPVSYNKKTFNILLFEARYFKGLPDLYVLPISFATEVEERELLEQYPKSIISRMQMNGKGGVLYDPIYNHDFRQYLLEMIVKNRSLSIGGDELKFKGTSILRKLVKEHHDIYHSKLIDTDESHSIVVYGNALIFKLYRQIDYSTSRDVEITRHLSEKVQFPNTPDYYGNVLIKKPRSHPATLGFLQENIPNPVSGRDYVSDAILRYYDKMTSLGPQHKFPVLKGSLSNPATFNELALEAQKQIGGAYLEHINMLGQRTAEMHKALASAQDNTDFKYEEVTLHFQKSIYSGLQTLVRTTMKTIEKKLKDFPKKSARELKELLSYEERLTESFDRINLKKLDCQKIRIHGHYHLSRILFTGTDLMITGFDGDLAYSYHEKKVKRSSIRDVSTMVYSLHRNAQTTAINNQLDPKWATRWFHYVAGFFINSYYDFGYGEPFIPTDKSAFNMLLEIFMFERALIELNKDIERRPDYAVVPSRLIKFIFDGKII